jgi:hypothetical protein
MTRFSTTGGGGLKFFVVEHLGFKGRVRWTPTNIPANPTGMWCSAYWPQPCRIMGISEFSHQIEIDVGVLVRF